jgi:predicted unusual protein kinase regulating ubiquinone biosynthesis (AarF/ABC1/UbiB family)
VDLLDKLLEVRANVWSWRAKNDSTMNTAEARAALRQLREYLLQEVDFMREARSTRRFRRLYARAGAEIIVPRVHMRLCTPDLIVMDYVPSQCLTELGPPTAHPQGRQIANRLMDTFIKQLVQHGLVHGDPHPGNLGVDAAGRLVMYDFGNVIDVTDSERHTMRSIIWQLLVGADDGAIASLKDLGADILDEAGVRALIALYRKYMRSVDIAVIRDGYDPSVPLPIVLPDKVMRLFRVYGMVEGTCKRISPGFNYIDMISQQADQLLFDEEFLIKRSLDDVRSVMSLPAPAQELLHSAWRVLEHMSSFR